ncbi:MAG: Uma2 family endonuclease [Dethiobacter sp.]|jgi:Uma2 family endonuclease|nr:Uma2 family endonuclease [Dethiobacter sp.]
MVESAKKHDSQYTYSDYLSWNGNERWELIEGAAYNMTPAPSRVHQGVSVVLLSIFYGYLKDKSCKVYAAPFDVRLPFENEKDEDIKTVVQPDIVIVCDKSKLDDRGCRGVPDLIIEITSPSTSRLDLKDKFNLYEKVGVREYWIADPNGKTVMVFKHGEDGRYDRPDMYAEEDEIPVGIFKDLKIDLKEVFNE